MIVGSFLVTLISALIATPFLIGTAIFRRKFHQAWFKSLGPVTELLVGIPSVVYGFIGLSVIVPVMRTILVAQDLES